MSIRMIPILTRIFDGELHLTIKNNIKLQMK